MCYRFNGGYGAVTCDFCGVMFDAGISYDEFLKIYRKDGKLGKKDICWRCKKEGRDKKKRKDG